MDDISVAEPLDGAHLSSVNKPLPQSNPIEQVKLSVGLTFIGLSITQSFAVLSAASSSRFTYLKFCKDQEAIEAAREALSTFVWQSTLTSGVLGVMAWAATQDLKWGAAAAGAGLVTTAALWWDMSSVVDKAEEKNGGGEGEKGPAHE